MVACLSMAVAGTTHTSIACFEWDLQAENKRVVLVGY